MADLETRIRRSVVEYVESVLVAHPPAFAYAERTRGWIRPVAVAAAVLVLLAVVVAVPGVWPRRGAPPAAIEAPPTLPAVIGGYSPFTGSVTDSPPGRAIAVFRYDFEPVYAINQVIVLAADTDRYRYIEQAKIGPALSVERAPVLLSGDGLLVAIGSGSRAVSELPVIDVRTGDIRRYPVDADSTVTLLAWSADGRWLAYATRPFRPMTEGWHETTRARGGRLTLLDAISGERYPIDVLESVGNAAFSPDGTELAIQAGGPDGAEHRSIPPGADVVVITVPGGEVAARVAVPTDYQVANQAAWSPDGSRLALTSGSRLRTVERDGAGWRVGPAEVPVGFFLGWRSSDRFLMATGADMPGDSAAQSPEIVSVDLGDGSRTPLARLDPGTGLDVLIGDLQLAYGLLPDVRVRPAGDIDHGPWPPWLRTGATAAALILLSGVALSIIVVRRARMRREP